MTVSSLTFTCDMCGKKEVLNCDDPKVNDLCKLLDIRSPGDYHTGDVIEICPSCLDEIKTFINMYPKKGE